jgi:hypothetical protein
MVLKQAVIDEHKKGIKELMFENLNKTISQLRDMIPKNDKGLLNTGLLNSLNSISDRYNDSAIIINLLKITNKNDTIFLLGELFESYITFNKVLYNIFNEIDSKDETVFIDGCIKYPELIESNETLEHFESIEDFKNYIKENDDYLVVIKKIIKDFIIPPKNRYIFIQLKRFHQNDDNTRIKLTDEVVPDKTLSIDGITYTLSGVIFHIGEYGTGHYMYIQCDQYGEYHILYDDDIVYNYMENASKNKYHESGGEFINENFINKNGYLFSYSRYPVDQDVNKKQDEETRKKVEETRAKVEEADRAKVEEADRAKVEDDANNLQHKELVKKANDANKEGENLLKKLQPVVSDKKKQEEEAAAALAKKKQEEEAAAALAKKKQEEEAAAALAKKKQEEEAAAALAKKKLEEEALAKKKQEEEAAAALAKKKLEEEALAKKKQEEEAKKKLEEDKKKQEIQQLDAEIQQTDCQKSYYDCLGVGRNASKRDITIAYRTLALKFHPDKNKKYSEEVIKEAKKAFQFINNAYSVLEDDVKRKEYNTKLDAEEANKKAQDFKQRFNDLKKKYEEEDNKKKAEALQKAQAEALKKAQDFKQRFDDLKKKHEEEDRKKAEEDRKKAEEDAKKNSSWSKVGKIFNLFSKKR